jgi:crossover junction endonuclease MUS81
MKNRQEAIESCANPLIAQWINELYMEAVDKESRRMFTYKKALESTIACKEIIKNGRDAMKLPGIGEYIATKVDRKISDHIKKGGEWHIIEESERIENTKVVSKTANTRKKPYTPAFRSAPFAILLVLFEERGILTRDALKDKGQKYCSSPIEPILQSAITTLTSKGMIEKFGNSIDLTHEGKNLAKKLYRTVNQQNSFEESENEDEELIEEENQIGIPEITLWSTGTFDIELLTDLREVKSKDQRDYFLDKLSEVGIRCSQRALPLGDFLWIAKKKTRGSNDEAVLDTIIERKTDSDFCSSIPDGRFKEQKHRLGRCGIKKVIYLLEDHGASAKVQALGEEKVFAALTQTQIVDKFFLRVTHSLEETVSFISKLHWNICKKFQNKDLLII